MVHCAVKGGNTSIINEPLSRDLDADSRSNDDFTPLMTVAIGDKESAFEMLIQNGADPSLKDNKEFNVLHSAAEGGNTSIINELFLPGLHVDPRGKKISKNAFEMLIQNGADPSLKAKGGLSLLHFAAVRERLDKSIL